MPFGRTSMLAPQATDLLAIHPACAKNNTASLVDCHMNANPATKPRMMVIKNLAKNGPVGVLKPRCTTTSEHIDHWTKMRRLLARSSELEASNRSPSSADSITAMRGYRFSLHTKRSYACLRPMLLLPGLVFRRDVALPQIPSAEQCLIV
jgi:hypothetical protein